MIRVKKFAETLVRSKKIDEDKRRILRLIVSSIRRCSNQISFPPKLEHKAVAVWGQARSRRDKILLTKWVNEKTAFVCISKSL